MPSVEISELDGVRVFTASDMELDGDEAAATVYFRIGDHDELLASSGLTRLSHQVIRASVPHDLREYIQASNDELFTRFDVIAPFELFGACMRALAGAISQPHWTELERQKDLLATADQVESPDAMQYLLRQRYGTVGAGTTALKRMAYSFADVETVKRWVEASFTRENAAIVSYRELPSTASFSIGSGERRDMLFNDTLDVSLPGYVTGDEEGYIAFQVTAPLTTTSHIAFSVIGELVRERLTEESALTPRVTFSAQPIDSDAFALTGAFPVLTKNGPAAVDLLRATLAEIAKGNVDDSIVQAEISQALHSLTTELSSAQAANMSAWSYLFPAIEHADRRVTELESLTTVDISDTVRRCAQSLLLHVPSSVAANLEGIGELEAAAMPEISGRTSHLTGKLPFSHDEPRLVFDDRGLMLESSKARVGMWFADCTAVFDNGLVLTVIDRSERSFTVDPLAWQAGDDVVAVIRANVPEDRFVAVPASDADVALHKAVIARVDATSGWRGVATWAAIAAIASCIPVMVVALVVGLIRGELGIGPALLGMVLGPAAVFVVMQYDPADRVRRMLGLNRPNGG